MTKKKNRIVYALSAAALVAGTGVFIPIGASATGEMPESCEGIENCAVVTNSEQLTEFFTDGGNGYLTREGTSTMIISGDFTMGRDYYISGVDLDIYFGDHTVTAADYSLLFYDSTVDIYGGESDFTNTGGTYAPIYLRSGATATMHSGVIHGGNEAAVIVDEDADFVLEDGDLYGGTWVVTVWKNASFTMNGGTITTVGPDSIGVSGNGSAYGENATLTLNAGTITSNDIGVYAPQIGGQTVLGDGLKIDATNCGVEVRAGELTVEGAEINVDEDTPYAFNPNGSGSTATGVGIAVAQHTTKQAITATVNSGVFTAPVAFAEGNPQHNPEEDVAKVALSITGGDFIATNGDPIVASEDVENFITGGNYSKVPNAGNYVANGYDVYQNGEMYTVDQAAAAYQGDGIFLQVGDSESLDLGEAGNKYATLSIDGDGIATVENRTITATAVGSGEVEINYNGLLHPMTTNLGLAVYTVGTDEGDVIEGEDRDEVADFTAEQIKNLIDSGEESNDSLQLYPVFDPETGDPIEGSGLGRLKEALLEGDDLFTSLDAWDLAEEYWGEADGMTTIGEQLGENEEVAMVYIVNLGLYANEYWDQLGEVTSLGNLAIEFDLEIPEEYREAPEGYTRDFSVLRHHRGEWSRPDATLAGDAMKTSTNEFSTYVVTYTDRANGTTPTDPEGGSESGAGTATETDASGTTSPETGTVTREGASAMNAAVLTAVTIGMLVSAVSFAVLIRRK